MRLGVRSVVFVAAGVIFFSCAEAEDAGPSGGPVGGQGGAASGAGGKGGSFPIAGASAGGATAFGGAAGNGGGAVGGASGSAGSGGVAGALVGGSGGVAGSGGVGGSGGVPQEVIDRADVELHYRPDLENSSIFMRLFIKNKSADPLPLAFTTVRYWFDPDGNTPSLAHFHMGARISGQSETMGEARGHQYAEVRFTGTTLTMADSATDLNSSEFQLQISGGTYDQDNDHSFDASATSTQPNDKITVYLDGQLIWGCEPDNVCRGDGGQGGFTGEGGHGGG